MLNRLRAGLLSGAATGLAMSAPTALADGVSEEKIRMTDLPEAVAATAKRELQGKQPDEVEKITYERILVLYEYLSALLVGSTLY